MFGPAHRVKFIAAIVLAEALFLALFRDNQTWVRAPLAMGIAVVAVWITAQTCTLLLWPTELHTTEHGVVLGWLGRANQTIPFSMISGFSIVVVRCPPFGKSSSLILYLNDGRHRYVADLNLGLGSVDAVGDMFKRNGVLFLGREGPYLSFPRSRFLFDK